MFRPEPMTRIRIVLLSRDERAVLWQLGADGIIELAASPDDETGIPLARQDCTTALSQMDNLSGRLERLREVLTLTPASPTAEGRCLNLTQVEQSLQAMEAQLGELPAERHQLAQQVTEKQAARARAEIVPGLTLPPFAPEESSFLHFAVGSLPATGTLQLGAEGRAVVIPLAAAGDRKRMLIIVPRRDQKTLHQTLQQAGFQQDLAAGGGIATSGVDWEVLQREYEQVQARLTETTAKLHVLATKFAPIWASAACTLKTERCLLDAAAQLSRTAAATLITGWVPQASVPQLERSLRARTQGRYVITATDPEKPEEDVPVLIRHARLLRPFGALVRGFGLPHYWEVEPTPFVAISYILMFGMMFGDVGHGFLLVAGGAIARWASRQETVRDAGVLLVTGGGRACCSGPYTAATSAWRPPAPGPCGATRSRATPYD